MEHFEETDTITFLISTNTRIPLWNTFKKPTCITFLMCTNTRIPLWNTFKKPTCITFLMCTITRTPLWNTLKKQTHITFLICAVCLLIGCLTSQQQASVSQGRICTDNFTCCHTEIEAADQTFHLTQSQYTDTGPTSPSADPITPGAWQGSHWSACV